jgi:hypothetical protein
MAYQMKNTPYVVPQAIAVNSATQLMPLGTRIKATDPTYGEGEFIYLKGIGSTVVGSCVVYNPDDWTTALIAANDIGLVAFAMSACVANEFGWYQIFGKAIAKVAGNVADNALVYNAASGTVDDAVVAGDRIKHAKFGSAQDTPTTGLAEVEIMYPFVDDGSAA